VGFGSSSEDAQAPSRCTKPKVARGPDAWQSQTPDAAPLLRFCPLQRLPRPEQRHDGRTCHVRPPAPSGDHNLLAPQSAPSLPALFHAGSALGSTLQSFLPPAQPCTVPGVLPLLAFTPPSGFCSARESATRPSGLDWSRARSSPGSFSLQGLHSLRWSGLHRPSPHAVFRPDLIGQPDAASGCLSQKAWQVSLETADPPGILGLMIRHACLSTAGFWSLLLGRPGYVTAPSPAPLQIQAPPYLSQRSQTCRLFSYF
jgi:hypothetical protein